jgi:hypothetical protein
MDANEEPQTRQKYHPMPGDDSYTETKSSPDTHRNLSGSKSAHVPNAAPCARRHIEQ